MSEPTTISLDAMGGDHGPAVVVGGVADYLKRHDGQGVRFLLHGDKALIQAEARRLGLPEAVYAVRHTDKVVAMDEKPAQALRRGKGSSLWNAIEAVKTGEASAAVSAGNTGALMAISKLILRMAAPGLERPAIVASWPTQKGVTAVLDVGANIESDAAQLVEFAIMGEAFMTAVHGVAKPTIGLLNIGAEDIKGHEEVREAARLLREGGLGLNYHGFVEGSDITLGVVDVIVTDGFTGNVALKTAEGVAKYIGGLLRESLNASLMSKAGALLAYPALQAMREKVDPNAINGGPLLGLNGLVVKSHGGATAAGFGSAIRIAADLARSDYMTKVGGSLQRLAAVLETSESAAASSAGEISS